MVAMLERVSMLCARVMRGMASRLKLVMRRRARICTNSGLRKGARKPIKLLPSGKAAASSLETAWTSKRQSARAANWAASGTICAPAAANSASGMDAARPPPFSTKTECFFFEQQLHGIGNEGDPGFARAKFFKYAKLH